MRIHILVNFYWLFPFRTLCWDSPRSWSEIPGLLRHLILHFLHESPESWHRQRIWNRQARLRVWQYLESGKNSIFTRRLFLVDLAAQSLIRSIWLLDSGRPAALQFASAHPTLCRRCCHTERCFCLFDLQYVWNFNLTCNDNHKF